jgi:hypothetical protein
MSIGLKMKIIKTSKTQGDTYERCKYVAVGSGNGGIYGVSYSCFIHGVLESVGQEASLCDAAEENT